MSDSTARDAAQYIRMSTDTQDLSPEMQMSAIAGYADRNGLRVVHTYQDAGRSGLTLRRRSAMKRLLEDVTDPKRNFSVVLVYDVSRWGRFQDVDASAYYEYHCRLHGVEVRYVQEPFADDASPLAWVYKTMKRAMAAEFSRELGVKSRAGQVLAVQRGFQIGRVPCLGFRRVAVSKADGSERLLGPGEHKAGGREHVRWIPGPAEEVAAVRRVFELYANTSTNVRDLALRLREEGMRVRGGDLISEHQLYGLLQSEVLLGDYVWGRRCGKGRRSDNDPGFHRVAGALQPVIPKELFEAVQDKFRRQGKQRIGTEELVTRLRAALSVHPRLKTEELKAYGCGHYQTYLKRFGTKEAAWLAAGAEFPRRGARDVGAVVAVTSLQAKLASAMAYLLSQSGVRCVWNPGVGGHSACLTVNGQVIVRVQVIHRKQHNGLLEWWLPKVYRKKFDWMFVIRADPAGPVDSILLRRDHYFAQGKWLPDLLPATWSVSRTMYEVAALFGGLKASPEAEVPEPAPRRREAALAHS